VTLLVIKDTGTDPELQQRLEALLALGDPDGEVASAYSIKEAGSQFYETEDPTQAADLLRDIIDHGSKESAIPEEPHYSRSPGRDRAGPRLKPEEPTMEPTTGFEPATLTFGKVILSVHLDRASPLACPSVYPVSVEFARELPCCRAVYYEFAGLSDSVPSSEKTASDPRPSRYQLNQFLGHPELTGSPGLSGSPLVWLHDPSIGKCLKRNPSGSLGNF
jgi:hypothetical protein